MRSRGEASGFSPGRVAGCSQPAQARARDPCGGRSRRQAAPSSRSPSGIVYAAAGSAVIRSHDAGTTWHIAGAGASPAGIESLAVDGDTLYCGTAHGFYRMPLPVSEEIPPAFSVLSRPHRVLSPGATNTGITVDLTGHDGPWQWRVDSPFPAVGPGGGVQVSDGAYAPVPGLSPGSIHRIYVTPTTDDGDVAYPSAQRYITVFAPHREWVADRDLSATRIAYWSHSVLRVMGPEGQPRGEYAVGPRTPSGGSAASWAPDGVRLTYARHGGDIWVLDVVTGESYALPNTVGHGMAPVWSPEGGRIAFLPRRTRGTSTSSLRAVALQTALRRWASRSNRLRGLLMATASLTAALAACDAPAFWTVLPPRWTCPPCQRSHPTGRVSPTRKRATCTSPTRTGPTPRN